MQPKIQRRTVAYLTAKAFDTTVDVLLRGSRAKPHCKARFAIWTLVKEFRPDTSLPELGRMLGGKDHTTVLYGLRKAEHLLAYDENFRTRVEAARKLVAQWRPGPPVAAEPLVSLVHVTPKVETPPAVKSEPAKALRSLSRAPESCGGFEYDAWFRNSLKDSEAQFLAIASREHPERVRVAVREAAE